MELSISVVMPVYNSVRYVAESVYAVLAQTVSALELIICDDCSNDGSWELLQKLAKEDKRIKLLRSEANTGSAKLPREIAVKHARAAWICWIDSDDLVPPNYLESLFRRAMETDADCVCSRMEAFNPDGAVQYSLPPDRLFDYSKLVTGREACMMTIGIGWGLNANGFLVRRNLWLNTSTFLCSEVTLMNADDFTTREILLSCRKVAFIDVPYAYRLHGDSITKKASVKLFEPLMTDCMVIDMLKTHFGEDSEECKLGYSQLMVHYISSLRIYVTKNRMLCTNDKVEAKCILTKAWRYMNIRMMSSSIKISTGKRILLLFPPAISIFLVKILHVFK